MSSTLESEPRIERSPAPLPPSVDEPRRSSAIANSLREFLGFFGRLLLLLLSIEPLVLAAIAPLSALLLIFPAAVPDESVIEDTARRLADIRATPEAQAALSDFLSR